MKKLLALILCVMMFVAVIPTAAFAEEAAATTTKSGYLAKKDAKAAADAAKDAIETMLKGIAADQGVFGTVSAIDSVVTSMAKAMFEGIDSVNLKAIDAKLDYDFTADDLTNTTKAYLRNAIGSEINEYMTKHKKAFQDNDDNIDPEKYMNTFAKAASDSLNSAKAQQNLQALMYSVAMAKFMDDIADQKSDLRDAITEWEDGNTIWTAYGFNPYEVTDEAWKPLALLDATDVDSATMADVEPMFNAWADNMSDTLKADIAAAAAE